MCLAEDENIKIWKYNIIEALKDLSDIELQKLTWAGKHSKFISSFTEVLASLYDDFDFKRYIEYCKSNNVENENINLFIELDELIDGYKDYGYKTEMKIEGYIKILNDQKWILVTKKASEIVKKYG